MEHELLTVNVSFLTDKIPYYMKFVLHLNHTIFPISSHELSAYD